MNTIFSNCRRGQAADSPSLPNDNGGADSAAVVFKSRSNTYQATAELSTTAPIACARSASLIRILTGT